METTIITISDPISVGFWLTIGATLAGVVITVLLSLFAIIIKILFG